MVFSQFIHFDSSACPPKVLPWALHTSLPTDEKITLMLHGIMGLCPAISLLYFYIYPISHFCSYPNENRVWKRIPLLFWTQQGIFSAGQLTAISNSLHKLADCQNAVWGDFLFSSWPQGAPLCRIQVLPTHFRLSPVLPLPYESWQSLFQPFPHAYDGRPLSDVLLFYYTFCLVTTLSKVGMDSRRFVFMECSNVFEKLEQRDGEKPKKYFF